MASCGTVSLRTENGSNIDVRIIAPCDSPARVVNVGKAPDSGRYSIAGDLGGSGACSIFGGGGSGQAFVASKTTTRDSGTPYVVTTITTIG